MNGWAASPHAWNLCRFRRTVLFSYIDQLDGVPERFIEETLSSRPDARFVLVGWSMGGSSALRLVCRFPERLAGLVLVAATPRMMEDKPDGWRGMSERRLDALFHGLQLTHGEGFFGVPPDKPNPYQMDSDENLQRGLDYLRQTDLRAARAAVAPAVTCPVAVFHSGHDGIVRPENAVCLSELFPQASVTLVPGAEHALPIFIPDLIDNAVEEMIDDRG